MFSAPESSSTVPAFVSKLWQMVCDPKYDDLISWCDNGSTFIIKDQIKFSSELLPMYYKHNNMASFIRQLNKYGFRKVVSVNSASLKGGDMSDFEFFHPQFIKGYPSLLEQIKRKVSNSKEISEFKSDAGIMAKILLEVQQLKQKQSEVESRMNTMKAENDALWRDHSILRQKHQKQQKIVNRLITFIVSLIHQTRGMNVKRRNMPLMLKDGSCLQIETMSPTNERQYRSTSPVICEIDPNDIYFKNEPQESSFTNNKPSRIKLIIPRKSNEDSEIVQNELVNSDDMVLEVDSPSTTMSVPLQKVIPSLVLDSKFKAKTDRSTKKLLSFKEHSSNLPEKRTAGLSNGKHISKIRKITNNRQTGDITGTFPSSSKTIHAVNPSTNISSKKLEIPIISCAKVKSKPPLEKLIKNCSSNDATNQYVDALSNDELLKNVSTLKMNSDIPENIFSDDFDYTTEEQSPISFSPSGTQILSPKFPTESDEEQENTNKSLVLSDHNSTINKQDVENHIDLMQADLDALKEILHGEGLSLDASTIMGLFGSDDPLLLNMPEAGRSMNEGNSSPIGKELVSYSPPNLIDIAEDLDDEELLTANDSSFLDDISSSLNTPQATALTLDFPSPPPRKSMKK